MSPVSRVCIGLCLLIMTGCGFKSPDTPTPSLAGTPATTTPQLTPTGQTAEVVTPGGAILPPGTVTLTIWTIQEFAPADDDPGGRHLLNQLLAFERSQPDATVDVVLKRLTGPGGIMDYFDTASLVAPDVLPDIAVLDSRLLPQAVAEGVIQPLDDLLSPETVASLFPAARELGLVDGVLMGVPFMLDFEHVVYNTAILTDTVPSTWEVVLDSGGPYLFPAAEDAPMDAVLSHYLAAGGTLYDQAGDPRFEIDPLTEVFRFYQSANGQQVIPAAMLQTHSLAESWNAYLSGNALIAHVNAALFLAGRDDLLNTAVAPIPGPEQAAPPLVSGWHWVIATSDPSHQHLAAELINWLMEVENLGVWSYASRWLPASSGALDIWPTDDPYVQFVRDQVQVAVPHPGDLYDQVVQPRLSQAVRDVLLGNSSPAAAADATLP
jgi:ABC-type glycerol-3-phosphate transport system substrate-binding protein